MAISDWSEEVDKLAEAFQGGGGRLEAWHRLYLRADLGDEHFEKLEAGQPSERFKATLETVLSLGDLVLYEVRDGDGNSKGLALARVLEIFKHSKSEYTVKIRFLASEDADVAAWGREVFNEKQDCRLHFCNGKAEDCRVKSRSKSIDFAHTDSWRICSYRAVMRSPWAGPAALEDLSIMVSRWLREHGGRAVEEPPPAPEEVEELQDILVDEVPAEARDDRSLDGKQLPAEGEMEAPGAEQNPGARAGAAAVEARPCKHCVVAALNFCLGWQKILRKVFLVEIAVGELEIPDVWLLLNLRPESVWLQPQ